MNFVAAIQPTNDLFIGRCLFDHEKFTRIEPLQMQTSQGWTDLTNRQILFPPFGNVFSFERAAQRCPEGTLRLFKVQPNTRPRIDQNHDDFIAVDVQEPIEVFDLTHLGDSEAVRRAIVEDGVSLPAQATPEAIFIVEKDACIRLPLTQDPITRRWLPSDFLALETLPIRAFTHAYANGPAVNGRRFVVPDPEDPVILRRVDWSPDSNFLRKVLRALQRRSAFQAGGQMHELGQKVVRQLALELRSGGALSGDPNADDTMLRRLTDFLPGLDKKLDAAQSLADELMRAPTVLAELESRRNQARQELELALRTELEPLVRAQIEGTLAASIARKNIAEAEAKSASARAEELKCQIRDLDKACQTQRAVLAGEVGKMLGPISDIVKLAQGSASGHHHDDGAPPWIAPEAQQSSPFRLAELPQLLKGAARQAAMSETRLLEFDALIRAGEVPLLFGSHAEELVQIYAGTVCGGMLWRMPIDATIISLDDLWRQPDGGYATGFAKAWRAAKLNPDIPAFVVLDDLDLAVVGCWLPRLASLLSSDLKPPNLLVAATIGAAKSQSLPPFELLVSGFPFDVESTPAAVAAAIKDETSQPRQNTLTHLSPPLSGAVEPEQSAQLAMQLLEANTTLDAARRAARVFCAAFGSMQPAEAHALAVDVAQLLSNPTGASQGLSSNCKSFAAVAARANSSQFN